MMRFYCISGLAFFDLSVDYEQKVLVVMKLIEKSESGNPPQRTDVNNTIEHNKKKISNYVTKIVLKITLFDIFDLPQEFLELPGNMG